MRATFNAHRLDSGMTYDELAEASGVSRRTLLNIGSGTYFGDLRTWLILARVWDVSLDELFAGVWREH
jgi:putative transcriptional regulator